MRLYINMRSEFRRIVGLFIFLLCAGNLSAQTAISPYSIFGNGERESGKFANQIGMGGISAGLRDPMQINFTQPASYSKLKYTTIDIGGFYQETQLADASQSASSANGGFNYLAFGFPLMEGWALVAGINPYSKIGYDVSATTSFDFADADLNYVGTGGFDRAFLGTSIEVFKGLSIGANASYFFGTAERSTTVLMENNNFYSTTKEESLGATGFAWDAGIQYVTRLSSDTLKELVVGATYVPQTNINGTLNDLYYTFTYSPSTGARQYKDTVYARENQDADVIFNSNYALGFTYGKRHKQLIQYAWSFGADYQFLSRGELNSGTEVRGTYSNGMRIGVGGQFIPYYAFDLDRGSYFSQVDYRFGAFYENTGLSLNNEAITDRGFTLGLGMPVGRRTTSPNDVKLATLNIGMVFGQRGLRDSGNIEETYARFVVGLTLNDKWFTQFRYR
ncbi:MAG: hypothetical protein HWE14_05120 [Flavobacteriia bacterium]|nr:hypothetical protein [Flavobacteriia bacterium]